MLLPNRAGNQAGRQAKEQGMNERMEAMAEGRREPQPVAASKTASSASPSGSGTLADSQIPATTCSSSALPDKAKSRTTNSRSNSGGSTCQQQTPMVESSLIENSQNRMALPCFPEFIPNVLASPQYCSKYSCLVLLTDRHR